MKELLRIYNVIELFERKQLCSKEEIIKAVSKDEEDLISYETWNRLRKKLDKDYGFVVTYHRKDDMSSMDFGDKVDRQRLMSMIHHFKSMNMMQCYVEEGREMIDRLEFETGMSTGDTEILSLLQNAMISQVTVTLMHKGYRDEKAKEIVVKPLYFKQYQNRWYLIAELVDKKVFRAFGMDRIQQAKYQGGKFKSRIKEAKKQFSEVVGVTLSALTLQDVVLAFDPDQRPYLQSLKLHHSQTVVEDSKKSYTIKIRVRPNYELQQQIQKFGPLVEVVKGEWECY